MLGRNRSNHLSEGWKSFPFSASSQRTAQYYSHQEYQFEPSQTAQSAVLAKQKTQRLRVYFVRMCRYYVLYVLFHGKLDSYVNVGNCLFIKFS